MADIKHVVARLDVMGVRHHRMRPEFAAFLIGLLAREAGDDRDLTDELFCQLLAGLEARFPSWFFPPGFPGVMPEIKLKPAEPTRRKRRRFGDPKPKDRRAAMATYLKKLNDAKRAAYE